MVSDAGAGGPAAGLYILFLSIQIAMGTVKNYLSLVAFSHTIFAMPFAMIGFALGAMYAPGPVYQGNLTGWQKAFMQQTTWLSAAVIFALVVFCMIFARSAAMAFNRYLDKQFDALNPRTAIREIPSGIISANHALLFTLLNAALFVFCSWLINGLCFALSPVALFVILGYSYTKRFTPLCHLVLGLGLSLAPIGAYIAVTGSFALLPILFSFAVIFWVSGFDIIYALQDEEFDKEHRLYSIPAALGRKNALRVSSQKKCAEGILAAAFFICRLRTFGLAIWRIRMAIWLGGAGIPGDACVPACHRQAYGYQQGQPGVHDGKRRCQRSVCRIGDCRYLYDPIFFILTYSSYGPDPCD